MIQTLIDRWRSPQVRLWGLSAVGIAVMGGCLVFATAADVRRLAGAMPPRPPEVAQEIVVKNAQDLTGRRASFRVLLFTDEFRWRINSHDALENVQGPPEFTDQMRAVLNSAQEIICVGASSEELPNGVSPERGRAQEEQRAGRRAERIALWVRRSLSRAIPVRKLNVGHHVATGHVRDTSDQRRVVIILVLDHDDRTNIDEALRSAMARESTRAPVFDALLTQYSLATGPKFAWVD
jgi:hypothetical protein